ncbi:iron complex outermembrane recepter protein [Chitinophaga costaii]|uniref:Iron complex outermembrane recepter protein n=1 Tax=Chitinophaga costaii TaxID=1335309 RepID=A0A1C4BMB7_9BACT|nr:TonB-dependent receptor [Chitinophaga costaii]PUZ27882.1 TonB-dependent receptor [Chitinophaga costaii]SCC07832.1 iron complex outermembrane recepter protein [Chitinophaga costaii]
MFLQRIVVAVILCANVAVAYATNDANSLSGTVADAANHQPLIGATVYFPDLHSGASADANGHFVINHLPQGTYTVEVSSIGYAAFTASIRIKGATLHDFELHETLIEKNEVVVTGVNMATSTRKSPVPLSVVRKEYLDENVSTNIVDAIAKLPGVSQLTTGPAISKPYIRGLGYNRVVVVSDDIRQEGQQWGDEHGIEVDDYNVSRVEVLKGPASLLYGSDALAGVVNIIGPPPVPAGTIKGNVEANYQTNSGLVGYHANIAGNAHGFSWSAYGTQKFSHDYNNKYDGPVFGSRFNNTNYGASIGLNKNWGFSRLTFSSFNQHLGIVEGERDSLGRFTKVVNVNGQEEDQAVTAHDGKDYSMTLPKQQINHEKLVWDNSFFLPNGGRLGLTLGYQLNQRREFGDVLNPGQPGLYLHLRTLNYALKYFLPETHGWQTSVGINGMQQRNENKGIEFLIPDYNLFDIGGFLVTRKTFEKLTLSGGVRFDARSINAPSLYLNEQGLPAAAGDQKFTAFHKNFSNVSASVGLSYQASNAWTLKANAARGFRAPNIAELSSNGVHEGTIKYEFGNTSLKPEVSTQGDVGAAFNSEHVSVTGNVFYNHINNFIFSRKLASAQGGDSIPVQDNEEGYAAFKYQQTTANLYGGELLLDIHPHPVDWLHFENTLSFVKGITAHGADSTRYLPNIPATHWLSELKGKFKRSGKGVQQLYASVQMDMNFAQNDIFSAYETETATPAYTLVNATLGADFMTAHKKKVLCSLHLGVNNLADVAYQNHLSRLKYAAENVVTGRVGVYNMGRNFSVKLVVPIDFK